MAKGGLVLYDGYCNLCSRTVQWIIRNDSGRRFTFQALQEEGVWQKYQSHGDTVLLVRGEKLYERSAAALHIACSLRFPWPLLGIFFVVPRFIRDPFYKLVARKRKKWFGERISCYIS